MPLFSCSSASHLCVNMWVWTSMTVMGFVSLLPGAPGVSLSMLTNQPDPPDPEEIPSMKRRHFAALAAASLAVPVAAFAQDRTIKILVGFPPGGSADVIARLLA